MTTVRKLYASVTSCSGINSISINTSYSNSSGVAVVNCDVCALSLNNLVTIDLGYEDEHAVIFSGRVKDINRSRSDMNITLTIKDKLVDASDYFLVADNPEEPWSRQNMKAEDLVGDLLGEAGITNYVGDVPLEFIYGVSVPATFNLMSVMDACTQISSILAWHIFCESDVVYFMDIKPYYRSAADKLLEYGYSAPADVISHRFCNDTTISGYDVKATIKSLEHQASDENIRNKVTVYGRENLHVSASSPSPYLPDGFYKTAVIASPLIDSTEMAESAARFNLGLYNRLTESCQLDVLGDPSIRARQFCEVSDTITSTSGYWFINACTHTIGADGYTVKMVLTK
jgi:hypothetical protein